MDDPIADGMNAAGNLLNAEPVKNLLSPVTKELGLVLRREMSSTSGKLWKTAKSRLEGWLNASRISCADDHGSRN
jgi:hypothetical protein